jgi:hypothetical protein
MGPVMVTRFGPFWSDLVRTWPVCSGRCGGCRGVVGSRGRSLWAEHCPFLGQVRLMMLPVELGGRVHPSSCLMTGGHQGLLRGRCWSERWDSLSKAWERTQAAGLVS